MPNQIIGFSLEEAFPIAEYCFLKVSGLGKGTQKHKKMFDRALEIYKEISKTVRLVAAVSYRTPERIDGKTLYFNGERLSCNGFNRLTPENVKGAYFYLLTAGEAQTVSDQLMDQLYGDIWGTALVDSGRRLLREHLLTLEKLKGEDSILSASFGPGYYGMELDQTAELFRIIEGSTVGVGLSPGGMMLPQKSVIGLYLSVRNEKELPLPSCENCIGGHAGCAFCNRSDIERLNRLE